MEIKVIVPHEGAGGQILWMTKVLEGECVGVPRVSDVIELPRKGPSAWLEVTEVAWRSGGEVELICGGVNGDPARLEELRAAGYREDEELPA